MKTKIMPCKCEHEYQDKIYGKGNRVHNESEAKSITTWGCTICGDKKS